MQKIAPFGPGTGPTVTKWRVEKFAEIEGITVERAQAHMIRMGWDRWMDARFANALPAGHHLAKVTKGTHP